MAFTPTNDHQIEFAVASIDEVSRVSVKCEQVHHLIKHLLDNQPFQNPTNLNSFKSNVDTFSFTIARNRWSNTRMRKIESLRLVGFGSRLICCRFGDGVSSNKQNYQIKNFVFGTAFSRRKRSIQVELRWLVFRRIQMGNL